LGPIGEVTAVQHVLDGHQYVSPDISDTVSIPVWRGKSPPLFDLRETRRPKAGCGSLQYWGWPSFTLPKSNHCPAFLSQAGYDL